MYASTPRQMVLTNAGIGMGEKRRSHFFISSSVGRSAICFQHCFDCVREFLYRLECFDLVLRTLPDFPDLIKELAWQVVDCLGSGFSARGCSETSFWNVLKKFPSRIERSWEVGGEPFSTNSNQTSEKRVRLSQTRG
jgi:hypothetical protein